MHKFHRRGLWSFQSCRDDKDQHQHKEDHQSLVPVNEPAHQAPVKFLVLVYFFLELTPPEAEEGAFVTQGW